MPDASGDNAVYVITVPGTAPTAGTQVVIDALQPGSLNQLWFVDADGYVVSALNKNWGLTTTTGNKQPITVSPLGTDLQYWNLLPNGWLAIGNSGAVYFANVSGGGNASAGAVVIAYNATVNSNAIWRVIPHRPEGLWFTIQSATSAPGTAPGSLLTLAENGSICVQPPMGGPKLKNGAAAINQLWKRTLSGNIVNALIPNMALTAGTSGALAMSQLEAGNDSQIWNWGNGQFIVDSQTNQKLPAGSLSPSQGNTILSTSGGAGSGVSLTSAPTSGVTDGELWFVLPHAMPFETSTTIRNAGDGKSPGLFLSLLNDPDVNGGYKVQVGAAQNDPTATIWQYQYPGYIVNSANDNIVLSLEPEANGNPVAPAYTNTVVAYARMPKPALFQLWDVTAEGLIVNRNNGQALAIPIPASTPVATSSVVTAAIATDMKTAYQYWEFAPGMALQTVLQQPSLPFPAFASDLETAYQKISAKLGIPEGVRTQYLNLAAPLTTYLSEMNLMLTGMLFESMQSGGKTPAQSEIQNCGNVIARLNKEITSVMAVQQLFQQATTVYLSLSQGQVLTLDELITASSLPNGINTKVPPPPPKKKKKSWIGDLIEGITYTALNVAGSFVGDPEAGKEVSGAVGIVKDGFPCFANLMATGFTTFQAAQQSPGANESKALAKLKQAEIDFYNYEMTVAGLQRMLLAEFEALGTALGQVETAILADWGKMQAVYDMIQNTTDMYSLYWPSTMTAMDTSQMLQTYALSVLKTLIPANSGYKNYATMHMNYGSLVSKGWNNGNYYMDNADATQNQYSTNIADNVWKLALSNGMNVVSYFKGLDGWNVPVDYQGLLTYDDSNSVPSAATIIFTFENLTNVELELQLTLNNLVGTGCDTATNFPLVKYTIPAYGAQQFAGGDSIEGTDTNMVWGHGLNGTNPGIEILAGGNSIFTVGVDNSYGNTLYEEIADVPLCSYTFPNPTITAPYNYTLTQWDGPSGMVFVKIVIMV
ncbi:RICIN domain-containing protein [Chitinophaga rhizosphaerae]|uniref:RICIN domain-containing protein n=1 Tax=Chitinophaga rhizosphaerae TaxID=1864947 RepID=UPI000F81096C|nr:RICIN domain-containing protein [Chitinophaga rhizosphaerae]